jgi:hypothetical protein
MYTHVAGKKHDDKVDGNSDVHEIGLFLSVQYFDTIIRLVQCKHFKASATLLDVSLT